MSKQAETVLDKLAKLSNVKCVEFDDNGDIKKIEFFPAHADTTIIREPAPYVYPYRINPWWGTITVTNTSEANNSFEVTSNTARLVDNQFTFTGE